MILNFMKPEGPVIVKDINHETEYLRQLRSKDSTKQFFIEQKDKTTSQFQSFRSMGIFETSI